MTKLLCVEDSYLKECQAHVAAVEGNRVQLDQTVFYPTGGGVPCDTGALEKNGAVFKVIEVKKDQGIVWHFLEDVEGLSVGDTVTARIDWDKRHKLMRMHTAAHVLGAAMYAKGVSFTGNQIGADQTRIDFDCPTGLEKEMIEAGVAKANANLQKDVGVKIYTLPREEAFKIPGIVKLAGKLPPSVAELRIVEIPDTDIQADGGPHVKNLKEVGQIRIEKIENKGAKLKRVYYSLDNR